MSNNDTKADNTDVPTMEHGQSLPDALYGQHLLLLARDVLLAARRQGDAIASELFDLEEHLWGAKEPGYLIDPELVAIIATARNLEISYTRMSEHLGIARSYLEILSARRGNADRETGIKPRSPRIRLTFTPITPGGAS